MFSSIKIGGVKLRHILNRNLYQVSLTRLNHVKDNEKGKIDPCWLDFWDLDEISLTLSWWRSLSHRNQFIDFLCKSMDWFLYDSDLRHAKVKCFFFGGFDLSGCGSFYNCSHSFNQKINLDLEI